MPRLLLEEVLKKKKMSKKRFAKKIGKDYPTTFRYYRPGHNPKLHTLALWAEVLNVRIRDLFEE